MESLQSEREVEVNRWHIHLADLSHERLLADMEEAPEFRTGANDHEAGGSGKGLIDLHLR